MKTKDKVIWVAIAIAAAAMIGVHVWAFWFHAESLWVPFK